MKKYQKEVDTCIKKLNLVYWTPHEVMVRLMEEVGELAREINHRYGPKKKKDTEDVREVEDEIGDIIYTLACLANPLDIDLEEAAHKSLEKYLERDKNRFKK